jgi:hypothetical protein
VSTVSYRFVASGWDSVTSAFKGITAAAKEAKKTQAESHRAQVQGAVAAGKASVSAEARRYKEAERTAAKIEREFAREAKAAERAASAKTKAAERAASAGAKSAERSLKQAEKSAAAEVKVAERADKAKARISAQREARQTREAATAAARRARDHVREEKREASLVKKRADAAMTFANDSFAIRARRFERVAGIGKDLALSGAASLGAVGVGLVGSAARDSMRLQESANRISINSRGAGKEFVDPTKLRKEFEATAMATPGIKSADVADAIAAFVTKTGNLDVARASQGTFATVASATGSDIKDVSAAAADLFEKFDVKTVEDMETALAALAFQGKQGSFELKDAAGQFAKLSAAASRFGLDKGVTGVKTLGGLTQIARSSTGSSEQAANAVEASLRQLVSKSADIKSEFGVDVFTDKSNTKTRDVRKVIGETIAGSGGDLVKLQKIFGEEGIRGISPLISTFNQARNNSSSKTEAGRTADGLKALNAQLERAIDAPGKIADLQEDAARAQTTASAQLIATWEKLQAAVGEQLTPKLIEATGAFANFVQNSNAIEGLVTVFVALADTAGLVVDVFKELGLIKTKAPTAEARQTKAQKELAKFDAAMAAKPMDYDVTDADFATRAQLQGDLEKANADVNSISSRKSFSEFADKYQKATGVSQSEATRLTQDINKDPDKVNGSKFDLNYATAGALLTGGVGITAGLYGSRNESADAKQMREEYQGQVKGDKSAAGIDEASKKAAALAAAFDTAAAAINAAASSMSGMQASTEVPD